MVYKRLQSFCRSRFHSLRSSVSRRQFHLNTAKKSLALSHLRHHSDLHLFNNSATIDSLEQIMPSPSESTDSMKSLSSKSHQQMTYESSEDKAATEVLVVAPASTIPEVPTRQVSPTQRLLRSTLSKLRISNLDERTPADTDLQLPMPSDLQLHIPLDSLPNGIPDTTLISDSALLSSQQFGDKPLCRTVSSCHADAENITVLTRRISRAALGVAHEGVVPEETVAQFRHSQIRNQYHSNIPVRAGEGKKSQEENMSISFDRMTNSQHHRMETVEETLILPDVGSRSLSDSCLHSTFECTNLNTVSDSRRSVMHKPRLHVDSSLMNEVDVLAAIKAGRIKTASTETVPRSEMPEVDEFGLPVICEISPPHEHDGNPLIDSVEVSPVSTPPISRCNSAAWSESYNGSDSWEDLRTESQVMNSVNQTIRHEAANVQRMQAPVVHMTPSTELQTPPTIDYRPESDENVWRTLRDQARATLPPQSPTPPHGRTIETLVPTNWPPRHGLNFRIEKPQKLSHLGSSSSSDFEELLDNSLSSYLQHSVSYLGDSGPRLVDRPSVELIEGTLLAKWCKKDNRTWLWKSSRRYERFHGRLIDPPIMTSNLMAAGRKFARRWKKDNRTWLWKSSLHRNEATSPRVNKVLN